MCFANESALSRCKNETSGCWRKDRGFRWFIVAVVGASQSRVSSMRDKIR